MKSYRYKEWDIIRGIGVLLVILGHSFPDDTSGIWLREDFYGYLKCFIYSFHMPLFVCMSGFLSSKILNTTSLESLIDYIKTKGKRLLIPYISVGIMYIPLQIIMSKYSTRVISGDTLLLDFIKGNNPNYQLWTLYVLFILNVLAAILIKSKTSLYLVSGSFFFISIISIAYRTGINIVDRIMYNGVFFFVGIVLFIHYDYIRKLQHNKKIKSAIVTIFIILECAYLFTKSNYFTVIIPYFAILTLLFLGLSCKDCQSKLIRILNIIAEYSMDIYIMSNLSQIGMRLILGKLGCTYGAIYIAEIISGIIFPIIGSKYILKKSKILQALILGKSIK